MSLIETVTPSETPQAGVKRPLQGKPTNVPNNLPAFRGRSVAPGGNVKVPKLSQGNRPNEGTNIPIPYNRVCPLEFLSGWTGRLAPGDVAFILKYPPGFLSKAFSGASAANNATNGTGTMSRVIGLDGLNRMLHGSGNANGWRLGENVLMLNDPNEPAPGVVAATSPLDLKVKIMSFGAYAKVPDTPPGPNDDLLDYARYVPDVALRTDVTAATANGLGAAWVAAFAVALQEYLQEEQEYDTVAKTRWRLSVLEDTRLDGIVKSNDEPYSFTSSGARDAVVFNNVIQGPTLVNNGYLVYDPESNPSYSLSGVTAQQHGAQPLRTVEAHPRGSIEGGYHLGGAGHPGRPGVVGSQSWTGHGQYDYVAAFTGTYTSYPAQMFDRHIQPMNSLYLGLRAYELTTKIKMQVTKPNGTKLFADRAAAAEARCYFYQYMPFASRKAWLCQHVQDKIVANMTNPDVTKRRTASQTLNSINNNLVNHNKGAKKSRFDEDIFDAVRSEDLANMVGAWHVGRVLDIKAQRHTAFDGGPSDTGFSLMVDVQVGWRDAFRVQGGAADDATSRADVYNMDYGGARSRPKGERPPLAERERLLRRVVETHNAQVPSMTAQLGSIFGSAIGAAYGARLADASTAGDPGAAARAAVTTVAARWPQLNNAWVMFAKIASQRTYTVRDANGIRNAPAGGAVWIGQGAPERITQMSIQALANLCWDSRRTGLLQKGLGSHTRNLGIYPEGMTEGAYKTKIIDLFRLSGLLGPADAVTARTSVSKLRFFMFFAGVRMVTNAKKLDWFRRGPELFPTLVQMGDLDDYDLTPENLDSAVATAAESGLEGWTNIVDEEHAVESGSSQFVPIEWDDHLTDASSSGVDVGTAASSLASSWHSLDDAAPSPTDAAADAAFPAADPTPSLQPTAASTGASPQEPVAPVAPVAPAAPAAPAAPTAQQAARSAPITAAPITAAAMAGGAGAAGKKRAAAGTKSPARTRGGAAATPTPTPTAAVPPGAASATAAPLLPSLAPSAAASTATPADSGAGVGTASVSGVVNPPAPVAARRRDRGGGAGSTSTVSAVFDSIFGAGLEQAAQADAPGTGAAAGGSPPASPTPSSGSEQGSGTGPKTFRRPAAGGGSSRPR